MIVHLLGLPGTGKKTVAQALGRHAARVGETSDARSSAVVERLKRLAQMRASRYVAVMLVCDEAELRRRVVGSDRSARRKWVDPDAVAQFARQETLVRPSGDVVDIDVTARSAAEVAVEIFRQITIAEASG